MDSVDCICILTHIHIYAHKAVMEHTMNLRESRKAGTWKMLETARSGDATHTELIQTGNAQMKRINLNIK